MSDSLYPMDCSSPGFSVHGILQVRILEWVAIPFSRGASWPRDQTLGLPHCRQILYLLSQQGRPAYPHSHPMVLLLNSGTESYELYITGYNWDWLLLLYTMLLQFIWVFVCFNNLYFFIAEWCSKAYVPNHIMVSLIQAPTEQQISQVSIFAMLYNIGSYLILWASVSLSVN